NATVRADGLRNRWSPELSYFYGGLGFATQYFYQDQHLRPSFTGPSSNFLIDVPTDGFYVMATYLVTGEERTTYSQPITPLRPFEPLHPFASPGVIGGGARIAAARRRGGVRSGVGEPGRPAPHLQRRGGTDARLQLVSERLRPHAVQLG